MEKQEFETFWKANRERILMSSDEYIKATSSYKLSSGADWLLFAIPIVAAIILMEQCSIERELLKWLAGAGITIVTFIICVWIKSMISGSRSPEDVEREIKERIRNSMK